MSTKQRQWPGITDDWIEHFLNIERQARAREKREAELMLFKNRPHTMAKGRGLRKGARS